ncbi:hypothetical protein MnTg02_00643 [bacterium MnTg02]|nr:hypothetical protein MnTg02_00643 [bacterium MnTg02]
MAMAITNAKSPSGDPCDMISADMPTGPISVVTDSDTAFS